MASTIPPVGLSDIPDEKRGWSKVLQTAVKLVFDRLRQQDVLLSADLITTTAPAQGGAYVQADVQAIADQANANTAAINDILTALKTRPVQS
jgi:hypothetical protein